MLKQLFAACVVGLSPCRQSVVRREVDQAGWWLLVLVIKRGQEGRLCRALMLQLLGGFLLGRYNEFLQSSFCISHFIIFLQSCNIKAMSIVQINQVYCISIMIKLMMSMKVTLRDINKQNFVWVVRKR